MSRILGSAVAFSLIGFAFAAPVPERDERKDQEEALVSIRRLGGQIYYDYQRLTDKRRMNVFDPMAKPKDSKAFHPIISLSLRDANLTDKDLKFLRLLPHLEILDLTNTPITGAGMVHVKPLSKLRVLAMRKTQVDDQGLAQIKDLDKMWQLILDETKVIDEGLKYLAKMNGLEDWLGLCNDQITDEGLKSLTHLHKLRTLNLRGTKVTKEGAKALQKSLPMTDISRGPPI